MYQNYLNNCRFHVNLAEQEGSRGRVGEPSILTE